MANVLLVDDRPENLLALEAILEPLGQNLVYAHSGEDALRQLLRHEVAVILLDVQMPELDGFDTATLIKQRERTRHVPIIFVTAISKDEEQVFRGYSAGAVDYVFKPFNPQILRSKVAVFIELYEKNEQLRRQTELLAEQELAELRRESEERYRFLAEAQPDQIWTAEPSGELDYVNQRALDYFELPFPELVAQGWTTVARLAVPRIADWVRVDVLEQGGLRTVGVEHVDAKKVELALELARRYPERDDAQQGPPHVVRTGKSELMTEIEEERLAELATDDLHLGLVRELGFQSYMCVPLNAHGRVLGAISFVAAESGRRYGPEDLSLAEELARRAGIAVENAQLYREVEERAQAARVLETVADGVFLVDADGLVRLWNRAAETISGIARDEIVGRRLEEVLPGWWHGVSTQAETMPF